MNIYLIKFQYQGDNRCEDLYRAYCQTDDEDAVEFKILSLPNYLDLEEICRVGYEDEEDEEDDWVGLEIENVSEEDYIDGEWFNSLEILIDER